MAESLPETYQGVGGPFARSRAGRDPLFESEANGDAGAICGRAWGGS